MTILESTGPAPGPVAPQLGPINSCAHPWPAPGSASLIRSDAVTPAESMTLWASSAAVTALALVTRMTLQESALPWALLTSLAPLTREVSLESLESSDAGGLLESLALHLLVELRHLVVQAESPDSFTPQTLKPQSWPRASRASACSGGSRLLGSAKPRSEGQET